MIRPSASKHAVAGRRSDADLMAAVARGELAALGEIYDAYSPDVWRVVHRLTSGSTDTDDLVQATFLQLPKIAASYDGRASCRAWLCGIAARLVSRWRRSVRRLFARHRAYEALQHDAITRTPESEASDSEDVKRLATALGALGARKHDVFVLVEVEGLSAEEVAVVLDVPAATVRTRLFHAKRELREAMKRGRT